MKALVAEAERAGAVAAAPGQVPPLRLPADLREFTELCGGLRFPSGLTLGAPDRMLPAGPLILGADIPIPAGDVTARCVVIAEAGPASTAERAVLDLAPERAGRCYEAFWDVFGVAGSMPIVALSFTGLLERAIRSPDVVYWSEPGFEPLGDAYD